MAISIAPALQNLQIDSRLQQLVVDHNFEQFVKTSTRKRDGNILDLVIARSTGIISNPVHSVEVGYSDHNLLLFDTNLSVQKVPVVSYAFRNIRNLNVEHFSALLKHSSIVTSPPVSVDDYACQFKLDVTAALDKLAPLKQKTKRVGCRPTARWMTSDAKGLKRKARHLERRYRSSSHEDDYVAYRQSSRAATRAVRDARSSFYKNQLSNIGSALDPRAKWNLVKEILHKNDRASSSNSKQSSQLALLFTSFFPDKLAAIATSVSTKLSALSPSKRPFPSPAKPIALSNFKHVSVHKLKTFSFLCHQNPRLLILYQHHS